MEVIDCEDEMGEANVDVGKTSHSACQCLPVLTCKYSLARLEGPSTPAAWLTRLTKVVTSAQHTKMRSILSVLPGYARANFDVISIRKRFRPKYRPAALPQKEVRDKGQKGGESSFDGIVVCKNRIGHAAYRDRSTLCPAGEQRAISRTR